MQVLVCEDDIDKTVTNIYIYTVCHNLIREVWFFKLKRKLMREQNNNLNFFYYLHEVNPSVYLFLK